MWCSRACACASAVAWPAEGVSTKSRPTATAKTPMTARRIFATRTATRNRRLLARIGRVGPVDPWLSKPPKEAELRVPSDLNGPALQRECGYRYYNGHGARAMPGTWYFPVLREACIRRRRRGAAGPARLRSGRRRGCAKLIHAAEVGRYAPQVAAPRRGRDVAQLG